MIPHRFFFHFNALIFGTERAPQRVALGVVAAALVIAPSVSALPFTMLWTALALLLPRRDT
jgi:hypothetical protein